MNEDKTNWGPSSSAASAPPARNYAWAGYEAGAPPAPETGSLENGSVDSGSLGSSKTGN